MLPPAQVAYSSAKVLARRMGYAPAGSMRGRGAITALRAIAAPAALASVLVAAPPAAAATAVDAGGLRAEVTADPWRVVFTDAAGRTVLAEHPGRGPGATGSLGFRAAGVWRRATRVTNERREGAAYVAELATTDPAGRSLEVRLQPDEEGVVALSARVIGSIADVESLGMGFAADPSERYLGFGERSNAVDQRGQELESYVAEGPYQPEERPFLAPLVPPWGFQPRDDATYFPIPWLLSTRGYGVLADTTYTTYHRLGSDDRRAWSVEVTRAPLTQPTALTGSKPDRLRLRVFAGPRPADALRRFTARTGRQPRAAAPWYFGPWFQPTGDEEAAQVEKLRKADAPVSVAQTYLHYLPCGDQEGRREEERRRTTRFHDAGLAVTTYFNPMLCSGYQPPFGEAASQGALTRTATGQPYLYRYSTDDQFLVAQYDFSSAAGRELYADRLAEAVQDGHDGWMEDFGEYTPLDSRSANGMDGTEMHNLYPVQYHCAAYEFARRQRRPLGRFQRSGFTGVAPCAQIVWNGDPTVDYGFDGLASALTNGLTMGLSGVSTWGSDIGGFFALGRRRLTPELLRRWVQLGAVSGVMRTQANGIAVPPKDRPQVFDDSEIAHWRRYAKLRTQLYPYLVAADAEYRRSGLPIMRHLALTDPGDPRAASSDDQLLFGPDLLAAPVLSPGVRTRSVYLPRGHWVDLWRSAAYEPRRGELRLGKARLLEGARRAELPARLDELPLLVRAGTVLPLLSPDVDTLAGYGAGSGVVRLADRDDRLHLMAFPRGATTSPMYDGERLRSSESSEGWQLRVEGRRERSYRLRASLSTLGRPFAPCAVSLDGRALPASAWSYDREREVLSASFRARSGRLLARARCAGGSRSPERSGDDREEEPSRRRTGASAGEGGGDLPFTGGQWAAILLAGLLLALGGRALRGRRKA